MVTHILRRQVKPRGSQIRFYDPGSLRIAVVHKFEEALERGPGTGRVDRLERTLHTRVSGNRPKLKQP